MSSQTQIKKLVSKCKAQLYKTYSWGRTLYNPQVTFENFKKLRSTYDTEEANQSILLFGDSVTIRISENDTNQHNLGDMINQGLKHHTTTCMCAGSAYHAQLYEYFVRALSRMQNKPKLIICPINIRSFSPQWDLEPRYQFKEELQILKNFSNTENYIPVKIKSYPKVSFKEKKIFSEYQTRYPGIGKIKLKRFLKIIHSTPTTTEEKITRKREIFRFHYMHKLATNHKKLKCLEKMIAIGNQWNQQWLFYTTPVNKDAGTWFLGNEFNKILDNNIKTVLNLLNNTNLKQHQNTILDLSQACNSSMFFNHHDASEHLNEFGRQHIAEQLINAAIFLLNTSNLDFESILPTTCKKSTTTS